MFFAGLLILAALGGIFLHKWIVEETYETPSKFKSILTGLAIAAVFLLGLWQFGYYEDEGNKLAYEQGYQEGKSEGYSEGYRDGQNDPYFG